MVAPPLQPGAVGPFHGMGYMLPLPFAARGNQSYLDFWVVISGPLYLRYITLSHKLRVARVYTKGVKKKLFQFRDLVWKTILSIGSISNKFGKWSPNWEGPYRIEEVIPENSYMV
jgi:hypothetical protein